MSGFKLALFVLAVSGVAVTAEAQSTTAALLLLQQQSYRQGHWDEFFGAAQSYRHSMWLQNPDSELVLLESLALARFCLFSESLQLIRALKILERKTTTTGTPLFVRLEKSEVLVMSLEKLRLSMPERPRQARALLTSKDVLWPSGPGISSTLKMLPPTAFRAHVESRCL